MKTIVMTGATSGIGLKAAEIMRRDSGVRLLIGARSKPPAGIESLPLDLERLASVRSFAAAVAEKLGDNRIDSLVLNAGMQAGDLGQRTEDGFETTFAVNHLAHYLLLRLLMPILVPGAIVVITTSNLHDPNTNPLAPPLHADAKLLACGQVGVDPKLRDRLAVLRAYASSKLCNIITARALASSAFAQERGLRVIAFNPGFTPGTALTRNHGLAIRLFFAVTVRIQRLTRPINSLKGGADLLADLALGRIVPPPGHLYASQVERKLTWPAPSELARDNAVMSKLWRDSAAMVGLPETQ